MTNTQTDAELRYFLECVIARRDRALEDVKSAELNDVHPYELHDYVETLREADKQIATLIRMLGIGRVEKSFIILPPNQVMTMGGVN